MSPAEQLRALEARKIDLGFVGVRPPLTARQSDVLMWECAARHAVVVVLPVRHPLAKKKLVKISDLKTQFFVAMSEQTHPGSRAWLTGLCELAGYTPRILQDVELESGIMTFVAEGLGVTLAREQIRKLHHPGVVFRPLQPPAQADYWIAWHRDNRSKSLLQYIEIVKKEAPAWH
jgi:DNA-binding transcriptional LysR family regulator